MQFILQTSTAHCSSIGFNADKCSSIQLNAVWKTIAYAYVLDSASSTINPRNSLKLNIQLNAVQCRRMQHNTAQYSSMQFEQIIEYAYVLHSARSTMNLQDSVQLNAAQCNSIQFNAEECSSIQLNTAEHSSMQLNEVQFTWRKREPWRGRSASEASPFNAKESVVICWNVLGSSGIVLKLFNSEARFPFFVRQVSKKRLECVHTYAKYGTLRVPQSTSNLSAVFTEALDGV